MLATGLAPRACVDVFGAVASSFGNKALKRLLNVARPPGAKKLDPGFPSSHANALAFLSVTGALHLQGTLERSALIGLGAFLSYLRIYSGHHTADQVIAGFLLGGSSALGWSKVAGPAVAWIEGFGREGDLAVKGLGLLAMATFGITNAPNWMKGR